MRVALLGRTGMLLETGRRLIEEGHEVSAVITAGQEPHYGSTVEAFAALAREAGAHFRSDGQIGEHDMAVIRSEKTDIGVSINWPRLIGDDLIKSFRFGILNGHAGDLPRYRGNACLNWAILNQESEVAVVVHGMEPHAVDVGHIYARKRRPLTPDDYIGDLYDWLATELPALFLEVVGRTVDLGVLPEPLPPGQGPPMRCYPRQESDAAIDWFSGSREIEALIRASSRPFLGAYTRLRGSVIRIWRASNLRHPDEFCAVPGQVLRHDECGLVVACGEGALSIEEWSADDSEALPTRLTAQVRFET